MVETTGSMDSVKDEPFRGQADEEVHRRQVTTEFSAGILSNIRLSRWYLAHCCIFALISAALIIALFVRGKKEPPAIWIVVLDGIVVLSLLIETGVNIILLGSAFWKSGWNILDFVVSALSIVGFVILLLEAVEVIEALGDTVAIALAAIRYGTQVIRVARYIFAARTAQQSQRVVLGEGHIRFPSGDLDEGTVPLLSS